ncbi:MAG: DUF3488 domain-containing transglutaminase family protein [Gammaproteobacteria bacterium]|nr:DUF3488 domain-containing transglutaminase family protein [Gammaproteobacteria bacterium]
MSPKQLGQLSLSFIQRRGIIVALLANTLPHLTHLPLWAIAFIVITSAFVFFTGDEEKPLNKLFILAIALAIFALQWTEYRSLWGRDAGTCFLLMMLYLKLFELRNYRDGMMTLALGSFLLITHFLFDQSVLSALYTIFASAAVLLALAQLNAPHSEQNIRLSWRVHNKMSALLLLYAIPLMLLLFIAFPRIPGPLWGMPETSNSSKSGLSDTMSPGDINNLALSDDPAFRVKFENEIPARNQLYWRGPVLWDFDGRAWRIGELSPYRPDPLDHAAHAVRYTLTLEPHDRRWLFLLDMPNLQPIIRSTHLDKTRLNDDYQLISLQPIVSVKQYTAESYLDYKINTQLTQRDADRALALPATGNPQTRAYAQRLRALHPQAKDIVAAALEKFHAQFFYTLTPPLLGNDSIDEFLFTTQAGFCEHFASSFVFIMRAAGIPARVVTGYQGGEFNPLGNYFLIKQADAHAWAEVWLDDRGWIRVDPTAAVSPDRIQLNLDAALSRDTNPRYNAMLEMNWLRKASLLLDSGKNYWNYWVLGYGPELQQQFFKALGMMNIDSLQLGVISIICTMLILLIVVGLHLRKATTQTPLARAFAALLAKLAKAGYEKQRSECPSVFLMRLEREHAAHAQQVKPLVEFYIEWTYVENANAAQAKQAGQCLQKSVRKLRLR